MFFCLYVELLSCFGLVSVECSSLLQILAYCPGGDFVFLTTGQETTPAECGAQDVQSESAIDPEASGSNWGF